MDHGWPPKGEQIEFGVNSEELKVKIHQAGVLRNGKRGKTWLRPLKR
jgi:hypothetical protein